MVITSILWEAEDMPEGLSINQNTGVISGTPATPGTYTPNITVITNWGTDTKPITINVAIPDSWKPLIDANQIINATADEAITDYTVTGTNVTVTA